MAKEIVTSAAANKMVRKLQDDKDYILKCENEASTYIKVAGYVEEKPDYDYVKTRIQIQEIDEKIYKIKHAINFFNCTTKLPDTDITVDMALIQMAQLNKEKDRLDNMRKRLPQSRHQNRYGDSSNLVEYVCANYDVSLPKSDYDDIVQRIIKLQMGIDYVNQTETFEIDI